MLGLVEKFAERTGLVNSLQFELKLNFCNKALLFPPSQISFGVLHQDTQHT
jgi:hypothetical protein